MKSILKSRKKPKKYWCDNLLIIVEPGTTCNETTTNENLQFYLDNTVSPYWPNYTRSRLQRVTSFITVLLLLYPNFSNIHVNQRFSFPRKKSASNSWMLVVTKFVVSGTNCTNNDKSLPISNRRIFERLVFKLVSTTKSHEFCSQYAFIV